MSRPTISRDDAFEYLHKYRRAIYAALASKFPEMDHEDTVQEAIIYTSQNHRARTRRHLFELAIKKGVMLSVDRLRAAACRNPMTGYDAARDADAAWFDKFDGSETLIALTGTSRPHHGHFDSSSSVMTAAKNGQALPDPFDEPDCLMTMAKIDESMPELYRGFLLMAYCGYTYEEMADLTGITVAAVKSRLHRARKIFKGPGR